MQRFRIDPRAPDAGVIAAAATLLRDGRLVAFPTETVYGLGANALDPAAVERIYAAKGRPTYNPIIVHVADIAAALEVVADWPSNADALARRFWPGPLTLVLRKRRDVPDAVTAGLPAVAVRVPAHPVARALLAAARLPIAAPSANRSMMLSPTTADHVEKSLGDAVDMILDGGPTIVGIESTVVDLSTDQPALLRPGTITLAALEAVIGPIAAAGSIAGEAARPSPGMLDRHYSPGARLRIAASSELASVVAAERAGGAHVGVLSISAPFPGATAVRMPADAMAYASRLYESLHRLDDAGCAVIVVERVPDGAEWAGVRDRLSRAAG